MTGREQCPVREFSVTAATPRLRLRVLKFIQIKGKAFRRRPRAIAAAPLRRDCPLIAFRKCSAFLRVAGLGFSVLPGHETR